MKFYPFFLFCLASLVSVAQPKHEIKIFSGFNSPQQYNIQQTIINDSTSSYLNQNVDPQLYLGLSYHKRIFARFQLFSQIIISKQFTNADLYARRSFIGDGGYKYYLSGIQRMSYTFLNLSNLNGLSYDLGRYLTLSCGVGFVSAYQRNKSHDYVYSYIPYKDDIADIGNALGGDVIKKYNINLGYSLSFHLRRIYLTARYQENLSNASNGFEYNGINYPLYGRTSSINLDLGYRFSW